VNEPYDYDPTTPPPPPQPPGQAPPPHGQGYPPPAPNPQGSYTNRSCIYCGYNLTGLQPGGTCPECGTPLPQPFNPSNNLPTNGMAVTAMVMGICSIPACFFYGVPGVIFGAIGLVLVRIARKQMEKDAFAQASHGFNQAGFICSLVGLILGLLYMLIVVGFIVFIVTTAPPTNQNYYQQPGPGSPQQWPSNPGSPGGGGTPFIAPGVSSGGAHGLDSQGRAQLPNGLEYGPNGQVRPSLPNGLEYGPNGQTRPTLPSGVEYGPGGRVQPATPGGFPSPAGPSGPSPF